MPPFTRSTRNLTRGATGGAFALANLHSTSVWVAGEGWRSPYRYSGIDIKTDRQLYQPGDEAQVLITTGYVDHPALLTVEGERIESYFLARFNGSLLTFALPIEKAHSPNASLTATVFADGAYVSREQVLVVPPVDKWLKVKITTDKPQYKPGESAAYTVSLTDHKDEPVLAELSFGLVDEAIAHYQKIVIALNETIRLMEEIDKVIDAHGGWPDAFVTEKSAGKAKNSRPSPTTAARRKKGKREAGKRGKPGKRKSSSRKKRRTKRK